MNQKRSQMIQALFHIEAAAAARSDPAQYALTPRDKSLMRDLRYVMRENQTQFWQRFGVAQSSGSRFERGMAIPLPVLLLIRLYLLRRIGDQDLKVVRSTVYESGAVVSRAC